jgi:hypothetical protein
MRVGQIRPGPDLLEEVAVAALREVERGEAPVDGLHGEEQPLELPVHEHLRRRDPGGRHPEVAEHPVREQLPELGRVPRGGVQVQLLEAEVARVGHELGEVELVGQLGALVRVAPDAVEVVPAVVQGPRPLVADADRPEGELPHLAAAHHQGRGDILLVVPALLEVLAVRLRHRDVVLEDLIVPEHHGGG